MACGKSNPYRFRSAEEKRGAAPEGRGGEQRNTPTDHKTTSPTTAAAAPAEEETKIWRRAEPDPRSQRGGGQRRARAELPCGIVPDGGVSDHGRSPPTRQQCRETLGEADEVHNAMAERPDNNRTTPRQARPDASPRSPPQIARSQLRRLYEMIGMIEPVSFGYMRTSRDIDDIRLLLGAKICLVCMLRRPLCRPFFKLNTDMHKQQNFSHARFYLADN